MIAGCFCFQIQWNIFQSFKILLCICTCADKAYEFFNLQNSQANLSIHTPETKRNVSKDEVPLYVRSMGGHAVVKIPYANAGQGVYCITNEAELTAFMKSNDMYDKYVVQSLIGYM